MNAQVKESVALGVGFMASLFVSIPTSNAAIKATDASELWIIAGIALGAYIGPSISLGLHCGWKSTPTGYCDSKEKKMNCGIYSTAYNISATVSRCLGRICPRLNAAETTALLYDSEEAEPNGVSLNS